MSGTGAGRGALDLSQRFGAATALEKSVESAGAAPMKPITDKAEISIDFPDKAYIGSFGHHSAFAVGAEAEALRLKFAHPGEDGRSAEVILHYFLLADIIAEAAAAIGRLNGGLDDTHRAALHAAAKKLEATLNAPKSRKAHR